VPPTTRIADHDQPPPNGKFSVAVKGAHGPWAPWLLVVVVSASLVSAGCGSSSGSVPPRKICGTPVWTGADSLITFPLKVPSTPWRGQIPNRSILPPVRAEASYIGISIVQVTNSCKTGRVVVITGAAHSAITALARASDRRIAGFTIKYGSSGPPIVIHAFLGNRQTGELVLKR
jgi:hypothetical protein